ncbi:hydantoinase/oxoprolinase family protein [Paraburkholderia azotifigens]|uniref:Hydantoinase/oxoprolinase family protein n=1 Tax=Paraburkholderia azotifigens TaxID=2057004 RepID=A0ABU9RGB4_9BURK
MQDNDRQRGFRLSADIGGTFTDIVLEGGGQRWSTKTLTRYDAPEKAIVTGVQDVLDSAGISAADVALFVHGMTLATNAVLERRGALTAFLTTKGFRDVLEIGYETRYAPTDLMLVKQSPLVPRERRFVVEERMSATGDVLVPLDEAAFDAIAERLVQERVESLAIGFLHAYANGAHEARARELLLERIPSLSISLSSEVCPEIREYERFSTVVANAYVQPIVEHYLNQLRSSLDEIGLTAPALLMGSAGGVMPLDIAKRIPIRLIESGPAGGAVLSASIAKELDLRKVLSFDMGGTTAKICFIQNGEPHVAPLFEVDRQSRFQKGSGLPLRTPVVELVEIGAGGGSIASLDRMNRIAVGPRSAASEPGPACYGRGGDEPTVTDSDLIMGRLDPHNFAGGRIVLDTSASEAALKRVLGDALSLDATEAAFGVVEIVDETMANAARVHAAELGRELSEHVIIAFGGAAPLHAGRLAEKLGIDTIIIPRNAGVGSALGFLRAPIAVDLVQTAVTSLANFDAAAVSRLLDGMRQKGEALAGDLKVQESLTASFSCAMRYRGQGYEIGVPIERLPASGESLSKAFEVEYATLFGRVIRDGEVEVVSWQLRLSKSTWTAERGSDAPPTRPSEAEFISTRDIFEPRIGTMVNHRIYERKQLKVGSRFVGPAMIVEDETSTVVPASFDGHVDERGNLVLTKKEQV